MIVADFRAFIQLIGLAELDIGSAQLGIRGKPRLLVWYQGQHIGAVTAADAGVEIVGVSGQDTSFAIAVTHLAEALRLLPDEEPLEAKFLAPHLTLSVKGTRFALRILEHSSAPPQISSKGADRTLTISAEHRISLQRALTVLDEVTGKKVLKPVLAGTLVSAAGGVMRLEATDGVRGAIIELPTTGEDGVYGVIPVADMRIALSVFPEGDLQIARHGGRVDLTCGKTRVRLALYPEAEFPDLSVLPQRFAHTIELSPQSIATAAKAAAILDTTQSVTLKARRNRIIFAVESQELGSFQAVGGEGSLDFEVTFEGGHLGAVEGLGSTVTLHLNDTVSPVMIEGEPGWRYWTSPLVYRL